MLTAIVKLDEPPVMTRNKHVTRILSRGYGGHVQSLGLRRGQILQAVHREVNLPCRQRFFDLLLALIRRSGIAARFELVLLAIQLQVKEPFQIAPRTSGASASAAECHLNIAE